jgi:hypothetical protein
VQDSRGRGKAQSRHSCVTVCGGKKPPGCRRLPASICCCCPNCCDGAAVPAACGRVLHAAHTSGQQRVSAAAEWPLTCPSRPLSHSQ